MFLISAGLDVWVCIYVGAQNSVPNQFHVAKPYELRATPNAVDGDFTYQYNADGVSRISTHGPTGNQQDQVIVPGIKNTGAFKLYVVPMPVTTDQFFVATGTQVYPTFLDLNVGARAWSERVDPPT